jgi:GNAT superfamily N-acetyltransferase
MTYHIEPARADSDFASIRKVYYETWLSAYRDLIPEAALKQLTPAIWRPERHWRNMLLAVTSGSEIIGACTYGPARNAAYAGWGELYSLYVRPAYQHDGVGHQLITTALQQLRADFCKSIYWSWLTMTLRNSFIVNMGSVILVVNMSIRRLLGRYMNAFLLRDLKDEQSVQVCRYSAYLVDCSSFK